MKYSAECIGLSRLHTAVYTSVRKHTVTHTDRESDTNRKIKTSLFRDFKLVFTRSDLVETHSPAPLIRWNVNKVSRLANCKSGTFQSSEVLTELLVGIHVFIVCFPFSPLIYIYDTLHIHTHIFTLTQAQTHKSLMASGKVPSQQQ